MVGGRGGWDLGWCSGRGRGLEVRKGVGVPSLLRLILVWVVILLLVRANFIFVRSWESIFVLESLEGGWFLPRIERVLLLEIISGSC